MGLWIKRSAIVLVAVWFSSAVHARPAPDQPMDARIAHREDLAYRFETLDLEAGQRHYRIWIGIPRRPAPGQGFPVVYLLDGNAALGGLTPGLLEELERGKAPVLVAIGHPTQERIDRAGRTLDYTPKLGAGEQRDPLTGLPSGGADVFLDMLETRIKPAVGQQVALDRRDQTLWGHSYGGLLVLHALLTRPTSFQNYAAASPSLWWGQGVIASELPGFSQRIGQYQARLLLMRGGQEPAAPPMMKRSAQPADAAMQTLLRSLRKNANLHSEYRTFPALGHGPMLGASLRYTLRWLNRKP